MDKNGMVIVCDCCNDRLQYFWTSTLILGHIPKQGLYCIHLPTLPVDMSECAVILYFCKYIDF